MEIIFEILSKILGSNAYAKWIAVALADCTGHGVPGALMSLMGYNILKQSLAEEK